MIGKFHSESEKSRQLQNKRTLDCTNVKLEYQQIPVINPCYSMETGGQLKMFFDKSSFLCKIPVITPGCSESESDIGNNIPGIPSDTLGISNWKKQYTTYIKNMWQLASIAVLTNKFSAVCNGNMMSNRSLDQ